jgi:phosphatidylglycerophosphatase A/sugar lactone lactonase YvrE
MSARPLTPATVLATWFGCGYFPYGPGTVGSLAATLLAGAAHEYLNAGRTAFLIATVVLLAPAIWSATQTARLLQRKDPGMVVIDEVLGQWVTLLGATRLNWKSFTAAFLLFRIFDIWKPWPIRRLERLPEGSGIIADDLGAGLYAAVIWYVGGLAKTLLRKSRKTVAALDAPRKGIVDSFAVSGRGGTLWVAPCALMIPMPSKSSAAANSHRPVISQIAPYAAIVGGEIQIRGKNLAGDGRPAVRLGTQTAHLVIAGDDYVIARIPENAVVGDVQVESGGAKSDIFPTHLGVQIADSLHPVGNPAVDREGNIFTTFSGPRGQKSPVSLYKVDPSYASKPFVSDLMNPTGLAFDHDGLLYCSSRHEGIVYQITPTGNMTVYVEGMGVATGIAFDEEDNLYVGDRSGTIFKISRSRQIYVFATLEPSIAAYHLAFGAEGYLYVTGPTTSSFDSVHRISHSGQVETFYRGLGRPQGIAFDADDNLYVAASYRGYRGIIRIDPDKRASYFLSGHGIVGLAFAPHGALILATHNALFRVEAGIAGRPLA